jgi:hypothetical protein
MDCGRVLPLFSGAPPSPSRENSPQRHRGAEGGATGKTSVGLDCVRPHLNPQVGWKTQQRNAGEPVTF